jgi:hypothetical protein
MGQLSHDLDTAIPLFTSPIPAASRIYPEKNDEALAAPDGFAGLGKTRRAHNKIGVERTDNKNFGMCRFYSIQPIGRCNEKGLALSFILVCGVLLKSLGGGVFMVLGIIMLAGLVEAGA